MADLDRLFQPTFAEKKGGAKRTPQERDLAAAITTYRYLRMGMVLIVIALAASLWMQWRDVGCSQNSISAYYYTPVRPIFVSAMVAIAVSLIVIKGRTWVEDMLLNFAGMLAPIVAFVPTSFERPCHLPEPLPGSAEARVVLEHGLPAEILQDAHNNIGALLFAGAVGLAIAVLVFLIDMRGSSEVSTGSVGPRIAGLVVTLLLLVFGWRIWQSEWIFDLHGKAAAVMFGALAVASIWNGAVLRRTNRRRAAEGEETTPRWQALAFLYAFVGVAMIVAAVVMDRWPDPWAHRTLVIEMVEIGLFVVLWAVQSVERWGKIVQVTPPAQAA